MLKIFILFLLLFTIQGTLKAQDIQVTVITDEVIALHPAEARNLTIIREVGGTMTAVLTDSGIVVMDSFVSLLAAKTARNLIIEHFPNMPFKYLINTHHHDDHIQGNQCFQDACIIAHANLLKHVTIPLSLKISSDAIITLGNKTFELLYFGSAHTDNDLVLLDREDRLLIMGDLFCYRKCYVMGPQSDARDWIDLLDKLIDRREEYDYVIPGHGGVVEDVNALIEQRDYLQNICDAVESARRKGLTLDQAEEVIRLEQYEAYMMYDRIGLDIEAYWQQLEERRDRNDN